MKIEIEAAPETFARLEKLRTECGAASYAEVISDALRAYEMLVAAMTARAE